MERKVLITTPYRAEGERYEYWGSNIDRFASYKYEKKNANGLRFLKKNIPQIDILEFPTWKEYERVLKEKDYDVVGFSFFTYEWPRTKLMVKKAEDMGVPEIWAGFYGALTPGIDDFFDRKFVGYSEKRLAQEFDDVKIDRVKHPMIVDYIGTVGGIRGFPLGVVFTSRGCAVGCDFCQTPKFCSKPYKIPLSSIEKVLKKYKEAFINEIVILDENFGQFKKHTEKVISLFEKYDMNWYPMTRVDILDKNLEEWYERGFSGTLIGVESLKQDSLDNVGKDIEVAQTLNLLERLYEKNAFVIAYYILGFEEDTVKSMKESIKKLSQHEIDFIQLTVLTPFPKTPLWREIEEEYGIIANDWSKWDTKHLVWNHPNVDPDEMREVLEWGFKNAYSPLKFLKSPVKYYNRHKYKWNHFRTQTKMLKDIIISNSDIETDVKDVT